MCQSRGCGSSPDVQPPVFECGTDVQPVVIVIVVVYGSNLIMELNKVPPNKRESQTNQCKVNKVVGPIEHGW